MAQVAPPSGAAPARLEATDQSYINFHTDACVMIDQRQDADRNGLERRLRVRRNRHEPARVERAGADDKKRDEGSSHHRAEGVVGLVDEFGRTEGHAAADASAEDQSAGGRGRADGARKQATTLRRIGHEQRVVQERVGRTRDARHVVAQQFADGGQEADVGLTRAS